MSAAFAKSAALFMKGWIMMPFRFVVAALAVLSPALALADPVGKYDVVGINPDNGGEYSGTVEVKRSGTTYSIVWTIAGTESYGVGLGGKRSGNSSTNAASSSDDTIAIGYGNTDGFGIAQYDLQPDGSWKGNWAYAGGAISTETWTPAGKGSRSLSSPVRKPASEAMKPISNTIARP